MDHIHSRKRREQVRAVDADNGSAHTPDRGRGLERSTSSAIVDDILSVITSEVRDLRVLRDTQGPLDLEALKRLELITKTYKLVAFVNKHESPAESSSLDGLSDEELIATLMNV
ncbi:MAG: hypothetical protein MN733_22930 [Nitrososphaera sp.]|nr:hypothetical protein [Nitrososphaera sp.]